jgi:hypothetical protein
MKVTGEQRSPELDTHILENYIQASVRKKRRKKYEIIEDN